MLYLIRNGRHYYFRLRIPIDLLDYFSGRQEVKKSLRTTSYKQAKALAKIHAAESEKLFTMVRSGVLDEKTIKRIVDTYVHGRVVGFEMQRDNSPLYDDPVKQNDVEEWNARLDGIIATDRGLKGYLKLTEWYIGTLRKDLGRRRGDERADLTEYLDRCLKRLKIVLDKDSDAYKKVCNELLKADIKATSIIKEHTAGNYDTPYDAELNAKPICMTFSELIAQYEREKSGSWSDASRIKSTHRQLLHIIGNLPLDRIERRTGIMLAEALKNYPSKLAAKDMNTPWRDLAAIKKGRLGEATQHFIITAFGTLTKYAKDNELGIKGDPAKGIAGKKPVNLNAHKPYTPEELKRLVTALCGVDRANKPESFWIPLLLLYTGARSNEVCMLRCDDIESFDNIHAIRFRNRPEYDQRTKNKQDRQAPVHQHLIELGFLEFVKAQRLANKDRLFDNLSPSRGKWNVNYGKDFNRTFKKKFLKGYSDDDLKEKDLHSFRKTLVSWFIQNKELFTMVNVSILQSIIGHFEQFEISMLLQFLNSSKLTTDIYGGGIGGQLITQNELLQNLDYGLDLTPLLPQAKT